LSLIFDAATDIYTDICPMPTGRYCHNVLAVRTGPVNFFIYQKDGYTIAIDTGFGKGAALRELDRLNIRPDNVSAVFLTHTDIDHADGVSLFPNADVYFSADEEQMVKYQTPRKYWVFFNDGITRPYKLLKQDDEIVFGGIKIRAIETPGHTPGSMCYFFSSGCLFTGDAFKLIDGKAYPAGTLFTMDHDRQVESMKKLAGLKGVRTAFTAHRGYTRHFDEAMADYR